MAGEMTKGLNILLHPKFTELVQRLDRLEALHKDLTSVVALKEERQEIDHLRDNMASQIAHIDSVIAMNRDKMLSLDELRNREIRALTKAVEQKATLVNLNHVQEQLHAQNVALSTKSENDKVEQLSKTVHALSEDVALKATTVRAEQLTRQLKTLGDTLQTKVDYEVTDQLAQRHKSLAEEVALRADGSKLVDLGRKVDALTEDVATKATIHTVEHLARSHHVLSEDVSQRADQRKLDHISRKLQHLGEEMAQKADVAHTEQAIRQIHALSDSMAQKAEGGQHFVLHDQVVKLREDMLGLKANMSKLDEHARQLDSMNSALSVNTSRVKHLSLMAASGGNSGAPPPQSYDFTLDSPLRQSGSGKRLPSLATQRQGMVGLPSMGQSSAR
mmetsp:Transcript_129195/g.251558  ORF Transcript_129195/g.251558 Transcript_129195/m.251558 type:complete len:389 (+) Transcript_129195:104-1270(+)